MNLVHNDESIDDLQLNNLKIIQKNYGFKFGIDAVLLSYFANIKKKFEVVDLCTGTGIVPFLLMGKYNPKRIIGVEIQEEMAEMANRSAQYNRLDNKVNFISADLKDISKMKELGRFDVLTVNPPYKLNKSGIINPEDKLAIARHEVTCKLEDVIKTSRLLLKDNGRMFMVHRPDRLVDILTLMRQYKIEPKRIQMVQPSVDKAPNIVLIEGQRDGGAFLKWEKPIYVYDSMGNYSDEINMIYGRK